MSELKYSRMEAGSKMLIKPASKYLSSSSAKTPFFLFVSDREYAAARLALSDMGLTFVKTSGFCAGDDKLPDIDNLVAHITDAGANAQGKNLVVTGLGEHLALQGNDEAASTLSRLKDLDTGGAKVVLLLRGLKPQIDLLQSDPRFDSRRFCVVDGADCDLAITHSAWPIGSAPLKGFKALLSELENGRSGAIVVDTAANLGNASYAVHKINSAYDGAKAILENFDLPHSCGSDAHWSELLEELNQCGGSLGEVFEKHGFSSDLDIGLIARMNGSDYRDWLYFINLKRNAGTLGNGYLRHVLDTTSRFEDFKANILDAIIEIPHKDKRFGGFYSERKALVRAFQQWDVASFIINNRKDASESIFKLTDVTLAEREEIIAWHSANKMNPQVADIYPALADYLKKYYFMCPEADLLTDYFEEYKKQKLSNKLDDAFLAKVENLASSPRIFNRLPTRNEILDSLDKDGTFLYWLDALGVEYLAFIEALAEKRGLSASISIARAALPTITSANRDFFDAWPSDRKKRDGSLDEIKHKESGGYNFENNELPIHLAKELDIIGSAIDAAATDLAMRRHKRFLLASDHGASRLAVLRRKEELYETETKGEHSGRCCESFHPYELRNAVEENGYLALADYGRFKGSRAANVEVHGGATLEEVVVPIITLTLKNNTVAVKLADEAVAVDYRNGAEIKLFINSPVFDVAVAIGGKLYPASQVDANHYAAKLNDIKQAGSYQADVYAGNEKIGSVSFKAQSRSGKVNDDFDNLF